jgi:phage terminase large subunit GpA-like protein
VRGHPVRYWFKRSGKRNEVLDRRVYALAALHPRPGAIGNATRRTYRATGPHNHHRPEERPARARSRIAICSARRAALSVGAYG